MSFFSDLFKGAKSHFSDVADKIKDDPERLFLGGLTPVGTEVWGGLLGKDWESGTNMFGGQTEEQFQAGEADGINMEPARQVGAVADLIAGFYGGQGLMDLGSTGMSSLGSGGGAGGGSSATVEPSGGLGVGDYIRLGNNAMQMGQPQQQQQPMQQQGMLPPRYNPKRLQYQPQMSEQERQLMLLYNTPTNVTQGLV